MTLGGYLLVELVMGFGYLIHYKNLVYEQCEDMNG